MENAEKYMLACIAFHNYLRLTDNACYTPSGFVDSEEKDGNFKPGEWRSLSSNYDVGLVPVPNVRGSRSHENAVKTRDKFKDYLNSEQESLKWQINYIRRTSHFAV